MDDNAYDPKNPRTWSTVCRPEEAEISSFQKVIRLAEDVKFPGRIHVAHVSTMTVVDAIANYAGPLRLSCGVTLHHVVFDYSKLDGLDSAWYKCNPPLRSPETRQKLLEALIKGRIQILESDHAPHAVEDKQKSTPASGIASGTAWPYVVKFLQRAGMSESTLRDVAFNNAVKLYGLDLKPRDSPVDFGALEKLQKTYPFDPFKELKS
ncbi:MAG TPA: dihydroorotase family protein [Candidatus Nanoarchaeia archaeon]|nr:dihydroorotase family protein [Candidatus Nanoarchaeia archaeon]